MKTYIIHSLISFLILFCILGLDVGNALQQRKNSKRGIRAADSSLLSADEDDFSYENQRPGELHIPKNYNRLEIPISKPKWNNSEGDEENETIDINVGVLIRKIREIDELDEEVTLEIDFIATWIDMLISEANVDSIPEIDNFTIDYFDKTLKTLDSMFLHRIWKPDLFFENVVTISRSDLISKPIKLIYSPLGAIIYTTRVTVKMDCDMDFHYYPADTQHCVFKIRSYSHTIKELNMRWLEPTGLFIYDRSDTSFHVKVSDVQIYNITEFYGLLHENYSETYSILQFSVSARRKMNYHLIQTYLPSVFFIGITWLCFLVPASMVEARIGIAMTTLLTLTSMFSSVRDSTPVVSYIKAMDLWMVTCIFFVFATLFEFAILVWLRYENVDIAMTEKKDESRKMSGDYAEIFPRTNSSEHNFLQETSFTKKLRIRHHQREGRKLNKKFQNAAIIIEEYAFIAFFFVFLFFNLIYWPWLLIKSDYFNWEVDLTYNTADDD